MNHVGAERLEPGADLGPHRLEGLDPGDDAAAVAAQAGRPAWTINTSCPASTSPSATALSVVVVPSTAGKNVSVTRAILMLAAWQVRLTWLPRRDG